MPVPAVLRWMTMPLPKSSCSWPSLSGGSTRDAARITTMLSPERADWNILGCVCIDRGLLYLPLNGTEVGASNACIPRYGTANV